MRVFLSNISFHLDENKNERWIDACCVSRCQAMDSIRGGFTVPLKANGRVPRMRYISSKLHRLHLNTTVQYFCSIVAILSDSETCFSLASIDMLFRCEAFTS